MSDWKFTGGLPPLSDEDWLLELEKYKQSPSISDFKFIYWMEYAHRMWGRALGIMFALPFSYFLRKGYITLQLGVRLSALFALGAGQCLIGWWMVKSGLEEPPTEYAQPRVSPYRLAAHLTSAFAIYCGLLWTGLSVVMPEPPAESLSWVRGAAKVKRLALPVSLLVGVTAVSGAFVAGNDAGHAYNTLRGPSASLLKSLPQVAKTIYTTWQYNFVTVGHFFRSNIISSVLVLYVNHPFTVGLFCKCAEMVLLFVVGNNTKYK
ncbi:hypothetical protein ACFX19_040592 [Malus domestica]